MVLSLPSFTQEKDLSFNVYTDIANRYVWRGMDIGNSPSIQPGMNVSYKGLSFEVWGAYATNGNNIQEVDWYLSYDIGKGLSVSLNDYFLMDINEPKNWYFNYTNESSMHADELLLNYAGPESFPISVSAGTIVFGADKIGTYTGSSSTNNNYSTYFELGYNASIGDNEVYTFVGATSHAGMYGDDAAIMNVGITGSKNIKITDTFTIPMSSSIIVNPEKENVFLLVGLTFE